MKKINVAIIGLGVGEKHLVAYNKSKYLNRISVIDFNKKKMKKIQKKNSNVFLLKRENDIYNDPKINLVSVASHDHFHYSQVIKSLKKKKNVFVEKPICTDQKQLKNIEKLVKKNRVHIESNFVLKTVSLFNSLKQKIKRNKKKIYFIEADYLWGRYKKLLQWRKNSKNFSLILGGAIHMIDLVCWLLDDYPVEVSAYGNNIALNNTKFKKNSFYVIILRFKNDLYSKITVNSNSNTNHFHELKVYSKDFTFYHSPIGTHTFNKKNVKNNIFGKYPEKENRNKIIHDFVEKISKTNYKFNKHLFNVMKICFSAKKSVKNKSKVKILYDRY